MKYSKLEASENGQIEDKLELSPEESIPVKESILVTCREEESKDDLSEGEEQKSELKNNTINIENSVLDDEVEIPDAELSERALIKNDLRDKLARHTVKLPIGDESVDRSISLVQLAREKASTVFDTSVHLIIAMILFYFQFRNCEFLEEIAGTAFDGKAVDSCGFQIDDFDLERDYGFIIAASIIAFAFISSSIIVGHARYLKDQYEPPVQNLFKWTNHIPIIGILLEIPVCFWYAPFVTITLWGVFCACCGGILNLCYTYQVENPAMYILNVLKYVMLNTTIVLNNFEANNTSILEHIGGGENLKYKGEDDVEHNDEVYNEIKEDDILSKGHNEGSERSAFILTACLVVFDLYRMTGYITQYYVINKSAKIKRRQDERQIVTAVKEYIEVSNMRKQN